MSGFRSRPIHVALAVEKKNSSGTGFLENISVFPYLYHSIDSPFSFTCLSLTSLKLPQLIQVHIHVSVENYCVQSKYIQQQSPIFFT
jgi:hypothetical protein